MKKLNAMLTPLVGEGRAGQWQSANRIHKLKINLISDFEQEK